MFTFIHPWSGQSGSGLVPHSPAPLAFAFAAPEPLAAVDGLPPASGAPAVAEAGPASLAFVVVPLPVGAVFVAAVVLVVAVVVGALAAGALDAVEGGAEDADGPPLVAVPSDFVQATTNAAIERRTGRGRMSGELTRNWI